MILGYLKGEGANLHIEVKKWLIKKKTLQIFTLEFDWMHNL